VTAWNKPIDSYDSVQTWFRGLSDQSGVDPGEDPSRLELLEEFCSFVELDPDRLVNACLLHKEGSETKISIKGRRRVADKIAEFQSKDERASSRDRAKRGNTIRSFLIHNGILLQSGTQL
jgi:hypothetical protein